MVRYEQRHHSPAELVANRSTCYFTKLPPEIVDFALHFLTGYDLLPLSLVNCKFYYRLLASNAKVWQRLAPSGPPMYPIQLGAPRQHPTGAAKQRYFSHESLYFHEGLADMTESVIGGTITAPSAREIASSGSFSFDICFAIVPIRSNQDTRIEAILLGATSSRHLSRVHHQQLVRVDPEGKLYCSVMDHQPIVAESLRYNCWYHLTLVFEATSRSTATQRVYLDGKLVNALEGWLNEDWAALSEVHLGSWCHTNGAETQDRYAFSGLVDECRFWSGALDADTVGDLASGVSVAKLDTDAMCTWSVRDTKVSSAKGIISFVHSTTPAERMVGHLEITDAHARRVRPIQYPQRMACCMPLFV